jgi:hypothetical protein
MLELADDLFAYEAGELEDSKVLDLFQNLVDTGQAWTLQGSYGRAATSLLKQGLISPAYSKSNDASLNPLSP